MLSTADWGRVERCVYLLPKNVSDESRGSGDWSYLRSGSHLSSLALEASNALLSPLRSHLDCDLSVKAEELRCG